MLGEYDEWPVPLEPTSALLGPDIAGTQSSRREDAVRAMKLDEHSSVIPAKSVERATGPAGLGGVRAPA